MITIAILAILLYFFSFVFNVGIFGSLLAFALSRPGKLVSSKRLAFGVLMFDIVNNLIIFTLVAPLDLTITTNNPFLIELFKSSGLSLSDILQPSFGVLEIAFYAIEVAIGTFLGKFLVARYYMRHNLPTAESSATLN